MGAGMADFTAAYCYIVNMAGSAFAIRSLYSVGVVCSDGEGDGVFTSNDGIVVDGDRFSSDGPVTFVGVAENGWLGLFEDNYYFFTPDTYRPADPVSWTAGDFAFCFLAGTAIATPRGPVRIEALSAGDLVSTAGGEPKLVRWVGRQTIVTRFADRLRIFPVRITAGTLGDDLPARDLLVSPDHALLLDGVLVQAGALVNGTTIVRETAMPERFTYHHVELDDHSLILAEGVPAETFLDTVTRRRFDNFAEYEALYGEAAPVLAEMETPRVKSARQLPAVLRARLEDRAAALRTGAIAAA
jgi:hypothetical protein